MCDALVGKIIAITNKTAIIDFTLAQRKVINLQGAKLNDFVVVRDNVVIEKVSKGEGTKLLQAQTARIKKKKKINSN